MGGFLAKELGEFSIGWLLLTVVLGGFFGALLKLVFETSLPKFFEDTRRKRRLKKQIIPILRSSASELEARLDRILFGDHSSEWLAKEIFDDLRAKKGFLASYDTGKGYFALSTSYVVIRLFASMEMMRRLSLRPDMFDLDDLVQNYDLLVLGTDCLRVDEPLEGLKVVNSDTDFRALTRHIQGSIGDFLIDDGSLPTVISFAKFVDLYRSDSNFRDWARCVEGYFYGLSKQKKDGLFEDQRVFRIGCFAIYLSKFLSRKTILQRLRLKKFIDPSLTYRKLLGID